MVEKNWLIRTRNKKLLGPVSKNKIRDLLEKGSLTGDDELSMGNGYWFWVREKDLLEKYVIGDTDQGFNPVSEAEDSSFNINEIDFNFKPSAPRAAIQSNPAVPDNVIYPTDNDLEYPEVDLPLPDEHFEDEDEEHLPSSEDLEYPDFDTSVDDSDIPPPPLNFEDNSNVENGYEVEVDPTESYELESLDDVEAQLTSRNEKSGNIQQLKDSKRKGVDGEITGTSNRRISPNKARNDRYLFIVIVILFLLISFVLYLYYNLFNTPFPLVGINSAHAQTISSPKSLSKKKAFLN